MLFEGLLLALIGAVLGLVLGHVLTELLGYALKAARAGRGDRAGCGSTSELWLVALALGGRRDRGAAAGVARLPHGHRGHAGARLKSVISQRGVTKQ